MLKGFSDEKIVLLLESHSLWGKRACREILKRKNGFIPLLIDILDEAVNAPGPFISGAKDSHVPASMLLAQMRVPEAYSRLVSLISYNEDDVSGLWGDILTEQLAWMLRDTFNGEAFLLPKLIEDRSVSPWSRAMAIKAWSIHYSDGYVSQEEIVGCFRHLINNVYIGESDTDDKTILSYIAYYARRHQLKELLDDIKTVYERDGIDTFFCGDSDKYVKEFYDQNNKIDDAHIDDAIQILEKWEWFKEDKFKDREEKQERNNSVETLREVSQQKPNNYGRVGRNDPCPCGSGRKYKTCCLGS